MRRAIWFVQNRALSVKTNIRVVHEDEDFVFLTKPAGVALVGDQPIQLETKDPTTAKLQVHAEVIYLFASKTGFRPRVIYSVDKSSSGLVVYGKSREAEDYFCDLLKKNQVLRWHYAVVSPLSNHKVNETGTAIIRGGILRKLSDPSRFIIVGKGGQAVQTSYKMLTKGFISNQNPEAPGQIGASLLAIHPITSVQQQIRASMCKINAPIVGDRKYRGVKFPEPLLHHGLIGFRSRSGLFVYNVNILPEWKNYVPEEWILSIDKHMKNVKLPKLKLLQTM